MAIQLELSHVDQLIQQSITPVFLLAGIGALISVLSNRIGRIHDRRVHRHEAPDWSDQSLHREVFLLKKRARTALYALFFCVLAELLICFVIAAHFIGGLVTFNTSLLTAVSFCLAVFSLILGLVFFTREIALAMSVTEISHKRLDDQVHPRPNSEDPS